MGKEAVYKSAMLFSYKKEGNLLLDATWMDFDGMILCEMSDSE